MDDAPTPFQPQVSLTPEEDLLEQNTREGLRALFHWAVFPFPLALIPLGTLSQIPVLGLLFGMAALAVAVVWSVRAFERWGDKAIPFGERLIAWALTVFRGTRNYAHPGEEASHADQARQTSVSLGIMAQHATMTDDTARLMFMRSQDGAEKRLAELKRIERKKGLTPDQRTEREMILRELDEMGVVLPRHLDGGIARIVRAWRNRPQAAAQAAPQGLVGLPVPGIRIPFSWALAAVLALVSAVQTVRVERVKDDARENAEFREGNRQVAEQWRENAQGWRDHARRLEADGTATAGVLAEREAVIARARANERRNRHAVEQVARDVPPVWFDGGVRPPGADALGRGGADGGGGSGAGDPG